MTKKFTIISQIITLLHISTLSCHPQGAFNQHLAKLHKYFKCSCWYYKLYYQQLRLLVIVQNNEPRVLNGFISFEFFF